MKKSFFHEVLTHLRLGTECLVCFFVLPFLLYPIRHHLAFRIFFILAAAAVICAVYLYRDPDFNRRMLTRLRPVRRMLKSSLWIFIPGAPVLGVATWFLLPDRLLTFPRQRPLIWLAVMILYPLLMAWPQELAFRVYFFRRYAPLFSSPGRMIAVNALSFSLAHCFYGKWVAPVLSFFGGVVFGWRYHVSQSLPLVSIEHALWGNYLFTIGIGWFSYSGAIT